MARGRPGRVRRRRVLRRGQSRVERDVRVAGEAGRGGDAAHGERRERAVRGGGAPPQRGGARPPARHPRVRSRARGGERAAAAARVGRRLCGVVLVQVPQRRRRPTLLPNSNFCNYTIYF